MSLRDRATNYRVENELPARGFVIFHRGKPGGWVEAISPENAREWVPGCLAVPVNYNSPIFASAGADSYGWGGSASWERIAPDFEMKGLL